VGEKNYLSSNMQEGKKANKEIKANKNAKNKK